jgi:uncharacterized iron-regulated protein
MEFRVRRTARLRSVAPLTRTARTGSAPAEAVPTKTVLAKAVLPIVVAAGLLAGCSAAPPAEVYPAPRLQFAVPPDTTYDLARAEPVATARLIADLRGIPLLFLGEQHDEPRSHAWQAQLLQALVADGRHVTVGLEMLPEAADPALEAWRQGSATEAEFLEASGWYDAWGFPWGYYADVFAVMREHRLPMHGLNADRATRQAVSAGDWSALPAATREAIGGLETPAPFADYLLHLLTQVGHGSDLDPGSPAFERFRRVQALWDRFIGRRAAALVQPAEPQAIVVVLVGSGHLSHKLGASLQAARAGVSRQRTMWDHRFAGPPALRDERGAPAYPVPIGMADYARVYGPVPRRPLPSLNGVTLSSDGAGLTVTAVHPWAPVAGRALRAGDVIVAVDGAPPAGAAALRLAYERLAPGESLTLTLRRSAGELFLRLPHPEAAAHPDEK